MPQLFAANNSPMHINRIKDTIHSQAFLMRVIQNVESQIKRELTDKEENLVISYVKNASHTYFDGIPIDKIIIILANAVIEELHLNHCEENVVDMHELLKESLSDATGRETDIKHKLKQDAGKLVEVNIDSIFGLHDIASVVKKMNEPVSSVNNAYFLLDSRYRILGNDGTGFFKWGHINSLVRAQGTYNSVGNIRDIISIKIMPFRIPAVASAITPYNRISTLIHELCPQSYVAHEERRFHFIGDVVTKTGNWLEVCSDDYSKGEYKFNKPVTHLDSMTLTFGTPLEPVIFDKDRLLGTITSYANPTVIGFSENHNLAAGDIVYMDTFATINSNVDVNIIGAINNTSGNIATITSPTEITIPVDTISVISALTGTVNPPSTTLGGTVTATNNSVEITGLGTTFSVDFAIGDSIEIQNSDTNPIFKVSAISSNTQLTLDATYQFPTGTYPYRKTSQIITGVGTLFSTELFINDKIIINDLVANPTFIIESIQNNTSMTITTQYNGADGAGLTFSKDNSIAQTYSVFFGSKRIFVPIEITYLSS